MPEVHEPAQVRARGQHGGDPAVFFGQVEAGDPATKRRRQIARRPADAATDVEQVPPGPDPGELGELHRRLQPAGVELIERHQVGRAQRVRVDAGAAQGREDRRTEIAARVVLGDPLRVVGHGVRSSFGARILTGCANKANAAKGALDRAPREQQRPLV